MKNHFAELSLEETRFRAARVSHIRDYWRCVWDCVDSGGTTWDALVEFGRQVDECLELYRERGRVSFLEEAEWLTAQAEYFRARGQT